MTHAFVTVVVPTRNSARTLAACLASIRRQTLPVELIVVDNHSTDATDSIARGFADRVVTLGPERSRQRNEGLQLASAGVIAFIDSDMVLEPGVMREAVDLLDDRALGTIVIPERAFGEGYLARCRDLEKRLYLDNPDVEAGRVFRTEDVRRVGGYREDLVAGEDWDLADRLAGLSIGRTQSLIWHDEGHIGLRSTFAKKRYYGRSLADYLASRTEGRPRRLARPATFGRPELWRSPHIAAGLAVLKLVEVGGLSTGVLEARARS